MQLTRFSIIGLLFLACGAGGQTLISSNRVFRSLSLQECIREALEQNLRIEFERHTPNVNRYELAAYYGVYYDPVLAAQYTHAYNSQEGQFQSDLGTFTFSNTSDRDSFASGVAGSLPTGLRYNLGLSMAHSYGSGGAGGGATFDDYQALANVTLSQPLLRNSWIDKGRLDIKIAKLDLKVSEFDLENVVRQVVLETQVAYYELIFAQDDVNVKEKGLELADALAAQNREKVRVGTLAPLDQRQAESQAAAARADLIQAQRRLLVTENVLKNLVTQSYGAWVNTAIQPSEKLVAVPEVLSLQESWSTAFTKRPDYLALVVAAERQGIYVKYFYNQLYPELNLVGGYGRNALDSSYGSTINTNTPIPTVTPGYRASLGSALGDIRDANNPRWNAGFILTVPFSRKSERNLYSGSKELKKQADVLLRKSFQDIQLEVDNAIVLAKGYYEAVGATREARVYAEEALAAEQTKLENGKSTSFNVLQLQRDLTTARSNEIRALANYNQALADLYYRDGTVLERSKISVIK